MDEIGRQSSYFCFVTLISDAKRLGNQLHTTFREREITYEGLIEGKREKEILKTITLKSLKF